MLNAAAIKESGRAVVDVDVDGVHTNIVMVKMVKPGLTPTEFCSRLDQVFIQRNAPLIISIIAFALILVSAFCTHLPKQVAIFFVCALFY